MKRVLMRQLSALFILLCIAACTTAPEAINKFSDPIITKIYDLQDRRMTDSLLVLLRSTNPLYKAEAALAFASVQDSMASMALGSAMLEDKDQQVRINAAFALGQTGGFQALNALIPAIGDSDRLVVREALEALGKTIEKQDVSILRDYHSGDTLLREGQAWSFYRLALRKKGDSLITRKASGFLLPENSYQTRLAAAHYFSRSSSIQGSGFEDNLSNAALHDARPEVRMAATNGFRHLKADQALPLLKEIFHSDRDYRVRVSAIRVCQNFPPDRTQSIVFEGLKDSVEMVQVAASEVIRNLAERYPLTRIYDEIDPAQNPRVKANLFGALLKSISPNGTVDLIFDLYQKADLYPRAALLAALGETPSPMDKMAFGFLSAQLLNAKSEKIILSSAASAIVSMDKNTKAKIPKRDFLGIYIQAIAMGDAAVTGIVSSALADESLHYKEEIKDLHFLYQAKSKLTLPRDIESLQPLEEAIAYLEGKTKPGPHKNEFNHPVDWKLVKTIHRDQKVLIKTTKGEFIIQLDVEEAPGSTANFVDQLNKKYFDGKVFHRVVPNFVIQTGCNRGDGYGSEDYSIRSEFSGRRYTAGSVGMASAGKDTEGTQWFVTHSPTPHLDGKYTIFGEVVKGMQVVHQMDIGDRILEAKLIDE
jgi:cyclophilin family peptidyl-prolyl cis-trans isomerase/HEAT repeat protein